MQLYVNLSRLNSSVSQLKRLAGEYRKLYRQLLQTVKTAPGWESQDGVVFGTSWLALRMILSGWQS